MSAAASAPDRRAVLGGSLALASAVAASATPAPVEAAAHPDAALLALAEEMKWSEATQRALDDAAAAFPGGNLEADLAAEAHGYVDKEIRERVAATPATTLAGLAIKARAVAYIYRDDFSAEGMDFTRSTDFRLIWSILADLAPEHVVAPAPAIVEAA